jgi:type I restriction enzyme S subunit
VLYGSRRTYLRKVAVPDFEGVTSNTTFVLEPKDPAVLLPELLPYLMSTDSFHSYSIQQSKGSVNPYINFSDLAGYEFALPPLDEQRRIADALAAMSAAIELFTIASSMAHRSQVALALSISERAEARSAPSPTIDELCECLDSRRIPLNDVERARIPGNVPYYGATGQVDTVL